MRAGRTRKITKKAEGFAMFFTVPRPKHHQKSVDRPQKSSACGATQESHRARSLLHVRTGKNPPTRILRLLAGCKKHFPKGDAGYPNFCFGPFVLEN